MKSKQQKNLAVPFMSAALLSVIATLVLVQASLADEPINISDIKECQAIEAKAERLLCYDTVAGGGIFNQQQLQKVQVESFGSHEKQADISVDELSASIVRVQNSANGFRYFHTSDGQVWKQQDRGNWSSKVPFEAEIKAGMLGSFFLVTEGGRSTRVKRVR